MDISSLRVGAAVVLRRVDRFGRYQFASGEVVKIHAGHATVRAKGVLALRTVNRKTGEEAAWNVGPDLSLWVAFPADHPEVVRQLAERDAGTLAPAVPPDEVRLIRALERMRDVALAGRRVRVDAVAAHHELAKHLVLAFGREEDCQT